MATENFDDVQYRFRREIGQGIVIDGKTTLTLVRITIELDVSGDGSNGMARRLVVSSDAPVAIGAATVTPSEVAIGIPIGQKVSFMKKEVWDVISGKMPPDSLE